MGKIKQFVTAGIALCLLFGVTGVSGATQINDAQLSMPFSVGLGNSDLHFAVDKNNGVEVGLKAKLRKVGDVVPVGNVYSVPKGYQTVDSATSAAAYAMWSFDFSVLLPATTSGIYTFDLAYDIDPSAAQNYKHIKFDMPASYQESWNYGMGFLGTGLNVNLDGTYDIELSVLNSAGSSLADSYIQVVVGDGAAPVPEPGTIALLGLGMAGLAVYGKRRQNKQA